MAYLGDIRENSIGPNGELWENGNRKEERFYWNGAFIDLCDLPVEEYVKTIFVTSGNGGGGGEDKPSGITNRVQVEVNKDEVRGFYKYRLVGTQDANTDLTVNVVLENETIVLTLKQGEMISEYVNSSVPSTSPTPTIIDSSYEPTSFEHMDYIVSMPQPLGEIITLIYTVVPDTEIKNGTLDESHIKQATKEEIDMVKGGNFTVTIPSLPEGEEVDPNNLKRNAVVLSIPKELYDKNEVSPEGIITKREYKILEGGIDVDVTDEFLLLEGSTYTIDGVEYVGLYRQFETENHYVSDVIPKHFEYKIIK